MSVQKKEEARIAQERKEKKWQKEHAYDELFDEVDPDEANNQNRGSDLEDDFMQQSCTFPRLFREIKSLLINQRSSLCRTPRPDVHLSKVLHTYYLLSDILMIVRAFIFLLLGKHSYRLQGYLRYFGELFYQIDYRAESIGNVILQCEQRNLSILFHNLELSRSKKNLLYIFVY